MISPNKPPPAFKISVFKRDPSFRAHFIQGPNMGTACQRFEIFQCYVLNEGIKTLDPSSLVLGCLLAFDGLATDSNLRGSYDRCASAPRWHQAVRVDWLDGPRINARNLSALTTLAIARVDQWASYEAAQDQLMRHMAHAPLGRAAIDRGQALWTALLQDAMGWLQPTVQPVLFGHVNDAGRLSALPLSALAREEQGLALKTESSGSEEETDANTNTNAYARAFESAMLGNTSSFLAGSQFVTKLIDALRPPPSGSTASKRVVILKQMGLLAAHIDQVDEVSALLFLFALDLLEKGTRRKSELAPGTPYQYVQSFAGEFHANASNMRLSGIAPEPYALMFRTLLSTSTKVASYRVAGLKAFHLYLRAWWQVPRLPADVFKVAIDARVSANVVWPHEIKRVYQWLSEVDPTREMRQLSAAFCIAASAMIRISELLVLRLLNVIDEGEHVVIEIAREIRDGKEKSAAGRRRLTITDPLAIAQIRAWLSQRVEENATADHYLFGDPSHPDKLAATGKMYFWMNKLLKAATGDDSISLHSLRHSIATQRFVLILNDVNEHEINPLDALANEAGHVGGHVTAVNYCHQYEAGLRRSLDAELLHLNIDYAAIQAWTGIAQATLRQRVSRAKDVDARSAILWAVLAEQATLVVRPTVGSTLTLVEPQNPLSTDNARVLRYQQVVGMLSDIASGLSMGQTSLRQDVDEALVVEAVKLVGAFADQHGEPGTEMSDLLSLGFKSLRDASGTLLGLRPDFVRLRQTRWALLARTIERCDSSMLTSATNYWLRALTGWHLAVRPGIGWDDFITLIGQVGINTSLMALRWSATPAREAEVSTALALAQATLRIKLGKSLLQQRQAYRAGRTAIWLLIGSNAKLLNQDGTANSAVGLHCCLLAAHVWQSLPKKLDVKAPT